MEVIIAIGILLGAAVVVIDLILWPWRMLKELRKVNEGLNQILNRMPLLPPTVDRYDRQTGKPLYQ